jgi:hypothetical protein
MVHLLCRYREAFDLQRRPVHATILPMARHRAGCLGCLGRFAGILVLSVLVGCVFLVVIAWVFTPWAFYMGGSFHALPVWYGEARVHGPSGDYTVYLWMQPARPGQHMSNDARFSGTAWLCTPRGERYRLKLYASMFEHPGTDTNGKEMRIDMFHRGAFWTLTGISRPELTFRGRWQNPVFVANDSGTLAKAFLPDGRLDDGTSKNRPRTKDIESAVFHEVPWTTWFSDCRGVK